MSLIFNSKTYVNDVPCSADIMRYIGPAHSNSKNDYVDCGRTAAKPTATFAGKTRARFKLTRTVTDGTINLGDAIADFAISIPVGCQESEMDALLADLGAFLVSTYGELLFQDGRIAQ